MLTHLCSRTIAHRGVLTRKSCSHPIGASSMFGRIAIVVLTGFALLLLNPAPSLADAPEDDCTECQWSEVYEGMWCSPLVMVGQTNCQWTMGSGSCLAWGPEPCINAFLPLASSSFSLVAQDSALDSPGQRVGSCSVHGEGLGFPQLVATLVES